MKKINYTNDFNASLEVLKFETQENTQPFFINYWEAINSIGSGAIQFMALVKQELPEQFKKIN